jgi:hypothetical protein
MTPKEFIKSTQNDVLLNDYTLQDVIWFMTEFSKQEVSEQLKAFLEHYEDTIDFLPAEPSELIDDYFNSL